MKRFLLMLAILMCSACLFTGCGGDGDDDSDAAPTTEDTDAGDGADPVDENAQFAAITPSGLSLTDKYTISGRGTAYSGTAYTCRCTPIPGATSYVFTTGFGQSETVEEPKASFLKSGPDESFNLSVYAINAEGFNTKTASATLNL